MAIEEEIVKWNNSFPIDRWWRQKYNVAYGSKKHRECDFFDQLFEYREEKMFEKFYKDSEYSQGDWLSKQKKTDFEKIQDAAQMLNDFDDDEFKDL